MKKLTNGLNLSQVCRNEREKRNLSVAALASLAKVSNRSIAILEMTPQKGKNGKKSLDQVLHEATLRQKRAWARVLTRIAVALDRPVDPWLDWLQMVANVSIPEHERKTIIRRAGSPSKGITPHEHADFGQETLRRLSAPSGVVKIPIGLLFSGQFTKKGPKGANSFLEEFVQRLFAVVNHRLQAQLEPQVNTVLELIAGLNNPTPRYHLIVGLFEMVGRRQYDLNFIRIPGWKIQLACLAASDTQLTWKDVVRERQLPTIEQKRIRPITVADDAWDSYLRRLWGVEAATSGFIDTLKEYDLMSLAETFRRHLLQKERPHSFEPILVTDQIIAAEVQRILSSRYKIGVKDIAATEQGIPRYQLAMATRSTDSIWTDILRDALQRELFQNEGSVMADLYADYMLSVLAGDFPSFLEAVKEHKPLPSYLELQDFVVDAADSFFDTLREHLRDGISKLLIERSLKAEDDFLKALVTSILPKSQRQKPIYKPEDILGNPVVEALLGSLGKELGISGEKIKELLTKEANRSTAETLNQNQLN